MVFYPPLSLLSIPATLRPHSVRTVPLPCCQVRAKCLHLAALRWYCAAPPEPLPSPARCASPATPPLPSLHPSKWGVKGRSVNYDMKDATSRSRPSAHVSVQGRRGAGEPIGSSNPHKNRGCEIQTRPREITYFYKNKYVFT